MADPSNTDDNVIKFFNPFQSKVYPLKSDINPNGEDPYPTTPAPTTPIATTPIATTPPYEEGYSGVYSMRLVIPTYTGPVVRVKKNSATDTEVDFYTDSTQSIFRSSNGTSYYNYLSGYTGDVFVLIWYDQTGNWNSTTNTNNGNNATSPLISDTINNPPTIFYYTDSGVNKYVIKWTQTQKQYLSITTPIEPKIIYCHFFNNNKKYGTILDSHTFTPVGSTKPTHVSVRFGPNGNDINGSSSVIDWYYKSNTNTKQVYIDNSIKVGDWNRLVLATNKPFNPSNFNGFKYIGIDNGDKTRSINGYMVELLFRVNIDITSVSETTNMSKYSNTDRKGTLF